MPDVAALSVVVSADTTAAEKGLSDLGTKVSGVGSAITGALGGAAIAAVAGLGAAFVGSVKTAADFEKGLSAISAVSGATATQLEGIRATALQLGKDTSFSATEAAAGMEEMVKAGVSLQDVMGGAGKAALDLAAAGGLSVAESATIASNAMNTFGKNGTDMAHIADVIAGAANASAIDVHDFGFSLSSVGAVAATIGVNFEDTAAAIAVLGQAGLKGSDAGTSLKTMLLNLSPSSKAATAAFKELGIITADGANQFFDAEGKAKSLSEISQILQDSLKGLTKEQQINALQTMFGTDAVRAAAIMAKAGAKDFDAMAEAMSKVTATAVAEERLNNLMGSLDKLGGSLETAGIMIGSLFTPALKTMADMLTDQVNAGIQVLEQIPDIIETIKQVMAGDWSPAENINPITNAVGELTIAFRDNLWPAIQVVVGFVTGTLVPALQAVGTFLAEHAELIAGLAAAWAAFAVISTVAGWIMGAIAAFGAFSTAITAAGGVIAAIIAVIGGPLTLAILAVAAVIGLLTAAWIGNWGGIQEKTATAIAFISSAIQTGLTAIQGFWTAHGQQVMTIVGAAWTIITAQIALAWTVFSGIITVGMQLLSGDWQAAWTTITTVAQTIWDSWATILSAVWTIITTLFGEQIAAVQAAWAAGWTALQTTLETAWTTIQGVVQAGWDAVAGIFVAAWNLLSVENQTRVTALITLITELWTTLGTLWTTGTTTVTTVVTTWWTALVTLWTTQTTALTTVLTTWWADIVALWTKAQTDIAALIEPWWTTIKGYWDAALKYITDALAKVWADIVTATTTFFTDLGAKFTGAVSTLGQAATDLGTAIMDAMIKAVNDKVGEMLSAVTSAVSGALNAAKGLLGSSGGGTSRAPGGGGDTEAQIANIARQRGYDPAALISYARHETGGYSSGLYKDAKNLFSLKGEGSAGSVSYSDVWEVINGQNVKVPATFRKYATDEDAINDFLDTIEKQYPDVAAKKGDPDAMFAALQGTGWATDPNWARNVLANRGNIQVPAGVGAAQRGMTPQLNQFGMTGGTLTAAEAAAFCGPAAAMWFAGIYGRMPDKEEAEAMARSVGWTPGFGMAGPSSQQQLNALMGVGTNVDYTPTPAEIAALAAQNVPFQLSTAGHYYQVQGGDLGGLNVGGSGVAAGGSAVMSLDQITALSGAMNGIITLAPQMGAAFTQASTEGGAALGGLLLSTTTMADGSTVAVTQMGATITATVTDAAGQVTAQYGAMAAGVTTATTTMAATAQTSVTDLGGAIMTTTTDMAGSTVTTITNMSGQVTSQYATLANGVSLTMGDMATGVLTSTTDLGTGVMTTVQDLSGNYVTTITDMNGQVTSQYIELGGAVTTETATMATGVATEVDTMSLDTLTSVSDMGDGVITITQTAGGEMVATVRDMAGNVTAEYSTMSTDASAETGQMAIDVVADFQQLATDAASAAQELGSGYVGEMQSTGGDVQEEAEQWMQDILDTLDSAIEDAKDQAAEIGSGITEGIAEGIGDGSDAVMEAVRDVVEDAIDEAKDEAESDSPSKLFARELGLPIAQGVAVGIEKGSGLVADATRGLVGVPEYAAPMPGSSGAGGSLDTIILKIDLGGRVAEEIYVTGRELAIARGRGG